MSAGAGWAHSTLSEESSGQESDHGQPKSKKSRQVELSVHSSAGSGDEQQGRKSRSRSKSGSGSDSGTARSGSSGSRASKKSRSGSGKSASPASGGNGSDSGTGGSRHSSQEKNNKGSNRARSGSSGSGGSGGSPAPKRRRSQSPSSGGSSSGSDSPQPGKSSPRKSPRGGQREKVYSSSDSSSQQQKSDSSSSSTKEKKLKKSKEHKASSKLEKQFTNKDSDDEGVSPTRRKSPKKRSQKTKNSSSSEGELPGDWRDECDDGLDDEYIGDEEDRRMLESLTEREREEEFYRRAEKREELKKRFEITQKLKKQHKQREEGSSSDQNRDGSTRMGERGSSESRSISENYSVDPSSRKKGYEEKYGSKFSALSELKAKREEKERKEKMREAKLRKHKKGKNNASDSASGSDYEKLGRKKKGKDVLKARDIYSSSSSDDGGDVRRKTSSSSSSSSSVSSGESDTERQSSKKIVKKAINIESLVELEKIRLSRFKLDKFVHLPCFKRTVVGCYVRIGIGKSPDGRDVYRCCEIVDTCETGKIYNVMKTKTNVGLKLRHGKDTRIFRLQFVSNSPLSETEFEKYKKACVDGNTSLPTYSHLEQKQKDIKYALEYRFSTADVEKILASKKKFDNSPKNFAMFKAEITKKRDMAQHQGDMEKVGEYDQQLLDIEKRAEELDAKRTSTISTIALVNDRNRKDNVARAYRGIKQEERRRQIEGDVDDPFTRRKTKPKLGNTKQKGLLAEQEMTSELLMKLELEKKAAEKKPVEIKPLIPATTVDFGSKTVKKFGNTQQVDIFDAHNFELDINVDDMQKSALTPTISLKPVTASSTPSGPHKRSIKLDQWKKKRGII